MNAKRPFTMDYRPYQGPRGDAQSWLKAVKTRLGLEAAAETLHGRGPWAILGLFDGCTWSDVKSAYRRLVMQFHPDKGGDPVRFREVQAAYEILEHKFGGSR